MSYNYQKVLFRRPFFTEMNVMFLWFLLLSTVLVGSITLVSYHLVHGIGSNVKGFYTLMEKIRLPVSDIQNLQTYSEIVDVYFSNGQFTFTETPLVESIEKIKDEPPTTSPPSVISAINNISSQSAKRSKTRYSAIKSLKKKSDIYRLNTALYSPNKDNQKKVNIQQPNFTDFEVVKGYRDHEEIISIANGNTRLVKLCIEKYNKKYAIGGKVEVKYSIHPDGHVIPESIRIVNTDIEDPRIANCIKKNISRWRNFPQVAVELGEYSITQKYIF
jgi:hypothetical protein